MEEVISRSRPALAWREAAALLFGVLALMWSGITLLALGADIEATAADTMRRKLRRGSCCEQQVD